MADFRIVQGFPADQRTTAVQLFWEAFRGKLAPVLGPEARALDFLGRVADPTHCLSALASDGDLLGVAGFKTRTGAFIGGGLADLSAVYGRLGALWRAGLLAMLERPLASGVLLMDGIMVTGAARGRGIGSALLAAIKDRAIALDCTQVRLDVIDTNPRARALYERSGFSAGATNGIGPLRHVFGFRRATTMIWTAGT